MRTFALILAFALLFGGGAKAAEPEKRPFDIVLPSADWFALPPDSPLVPPPYQAGMLNQKTHAIILMIGVLSEQPAVEQVELLRMSTCANGITCAKTDRLADGSGASFAMGRGEDKGRVGVRDLCGPGKCQLQLFAQWPAAQDAASSKDFEFVLRTSKVVR